MRAPRAPAVVAACARCIARSGRLVRAPRAPAVVAACARCHASCGRLVRAARAPAAVAARARCCARCSCLVCSLCAPVLCAHIGITALRLPFARAALPCPLPPPPARLVRACRRQRVHAAPPRAHRLSPARKAPALRPRRPRAARRVMRLPRPRLGCAFRCQAGARRRARCACRARTPRALRRQRLATGALYAPAAPRASASRRRVPQFALSRLSCGYAQGEAAFHLVRAERRLRERCLAASTTVPARFQPATTRAHARPLPFSIGFPGSTAQAARPSRRRPPAVHTSSSPCQRSYRPA
eukprot:242759-Pleurochrysis_carterae.AAC.1